MDKKMPDSRAIICTPSTFAKSALFYIQQIGQMKSLKPHLHSRSGLDSYLILIVLNGSGTFIYRNITYQLIRGDLLFIDCRIPYTYESSNDSPLDLMWMHFNGPNMDQYYKYFKTRFRTVIIRTTDYVYFLALHDQLMKLAATIISGSELEISSLIYQFIIKIINIQNNEDVFIKPEKLETIRNYIEKHFEQKITLEILSAKYSVSKFHLTREFKKYYGISINNYLNNCRITRGKELLVNSQLRINQIAVIVGISDNNYFNKLFQKAEGITPGEYRKNWQDSSR